MRVVDREEAVAKRQQLFWYASFCLGKYGSHPGCLAAAPLYKVGGACGPFHLYFEYRLA